MIKTVSLQNFKCFASRQEISLAKVTILYGHNGRGKSSLSQALLLIGQSMEERNDIDQLVIVGEKVKLDSFADIKTVGSAKNEIKFWIETDKELLEMGFSPYLDKPQLGKLSTLIYNGEDRFDVQTTQSAQVLDGRIITVKRPSPSTTPPSPLRAKNRKTVRLKNRNVILT